MTDGATAVPEVQILLQVLAAGRDVAELGAAYGETAALLAETAHLVVTVERDLDRLAVARARLHSLANVELLEGDAYERLRAAAAHSASSSPTAGVPTTGRRSSLSSSPAA